MTFEDLFYQYYKEVVGYAMSIVKNRIAAEEIAQEVFIRFHRYGTENVQYTKPWLYKTTLFLSYNYLRSQKREIKTEENLIALEFDTKATQNVDTDPEEVFVKKEMNYEIHQVLSKMTDTEKNILQLKYNGFSYKEIAKALNININSVGKTLSRAREKFYFLYKNEGGKKT